MNNQLLIDFGKSILGESFNVNFLEIPSLIITGDETSGKHLYLKRLIGNVLENTSKNDIELFYISGQGIESTLKNVESLKNKSEFDINKNIDYIYNELLERFNFLSGCGFENVNEYNSAIENGTINKNFKTVIEKQKFDYKHFKFGEKLKILIVVIDEIDKIGGFLSEKIQKFGEILAMNRKAGIHFIITAENMLKFGTASINGNITHHIILKNSTTGIYQLFLDNANEILYLRGIGDCMLYGYKFRNKLKFPLPLNFAIRSKFLYFDELEKSILIHNFK